MAAALADRSLPPEDGKYDGKSEKEKDNELSLSLKITVNGCLLLS